jgi:intergrase/recombinase
MLVKWMVSKGYSDQYRKDVLRYLNWYVGEIGGPSDVIDVCSNVQRGRRHLVLALRVLFNFYEAMGVDREFLQALRDALPKVKCGIDLKIPSESEIVESLRRLICAPLKYQALYNLLLTLG